MELEDSKLESMDQGASISLISGQLTSALHFKSHAHCLIIDGIMGDGISRHYIQANLYSIFTEPRKHVTL